MVLIAAIFSLFTTTLALAQTEEVFSVHVYECEDKIELLDYKENYDINPEFNYNLGGGSVDEKIELLIKRMQSFEPLRAKMYKSWHQELKSKTRRLSGMDLGRPDDNFSFVNWDGCKIRVLAKGTDPSNEGKTLFIDQNLWSKLDNKTKAGAYFNIFLNIEHIVFNLQETTMNSRYLNALMASNQHSSLSPLEKLQLYDLLEYTTVASYGLGFKLETFFNGRDFNMHYDEHGALRAGIYQTPKTFLNWTNVDLMPKFINAKNFKLGHYYGTFELGEDNTFEIEATLPQQKNCLGKFDLSNVNYVKLEVELSELGKLISKVHGRFKIGNKVFGTIEASDNSFIATTQLRHKNDIDRAEEVRVCHE
tara:strand:+ start:204318 stop:205409 length:1092 start_codon:yes stop_codon:yes gene_type:complete